MLKHLTVEQNEDLERSVTYDEIKRELIDKDVANDVYDFFISSKFPPGCNSSFITFIPETQDAKVVKDWQPISLIGSVYKTIAKNMANRLSTVILDLISDVQSAFISNHQILDSPFILNELISWCKYKKTKAMIFKADFEKAFDLVRWDYLDDILNKFGFGFKWRRWIQGCLNPAMGLKINIHKSKLMGTGIPQEDVNSAANLICCSALSMPFNYLGVKVGASSSSSGSWEEVLTKISSCLSKWNLKTISIDGRLMNFFNGVDNIERKISMIGWKKVLASKKKGGLGVSSFFALNRTLLFKWIWRFISHGSSLRSRFIKAMYGVRGSLDNPGILSKHSTLSDIIREVRCLSLKGINLHSYVKKKVGNGELTVFWEDAWLTDSPLKLTFPRLYALECDKDDSVAAKLGDRSLIGDFSVKSARSHIDDILLPSVGAAMRWVNVVPLKINVFAWKVCLDKLPTRFNLSLRGLDIPSILCLICSSARESSSHLFFSCNVARHLLLKVARWWDLDSFDLHSYDNWISWFSALRLAKGLKDVLEGVFYVMWWVIWKFRNQVLFGKSQPHLELLFDEIVLLFYYWCSSRCKSKFDWIS
nr:RNA-directed DNA polymerase, eukaryota, reverse transcriptase zinc-binding domain protein [Tanacetum cinerariifolium]